MHRILHLLALSITFGCGCDAAPSGPPTWHGDVAPIVAEHCGACHVEDGIGVPLTTYGQARIHHRAIVEMTASGEMPPYFADTTGSCRPLRDALVVPPDDLAVLRAWSEAGAPEGERRPAPPLPAPPTLERADVTLDPGVGYVPDAELRDDYRCFVVESGTRTAAFVTGFEIRPGTADQVHHVIVFATPDVETEAHVVALDESDPAPGYACFGDAGDPRATLLALWAPGGGAVTFPAETGLPLRAGAKLVMQIHYHPAGAPHADRTTARLALADRVTYEAALASVLPTELRIPARTFDVRVDVDSFLPAGARIWGIAPHLHTLGTAVTVETAAGCALDLPRWDFAWQRMYWYEEPLVVSDAGSLRVSCWYDIPTDRIVTWGEGTDDEMCVAFLYVTR